MPRETQPVAAGSNTWTSREAYLLALVCLFVGLVLGYLFRGSSPPAATALGANPAVATPAPAPGQGPTHSAEALAPFAAPLLAALQTDPKNVEALVQLGNLYYDNHVYPQAIDYYTRALELRPADVNVRTDLGTSYWYSNMPEKAVAEYNKSLAIEPHHAPTLFNLGIVQLEGLNNPAAAVAAWEKLLATNPGYPERARVLALLDRARQQKK